MSDNEEMNLKIKINTYSSTAPPRTNKSRKNGNIERTSITFMASLRNFIFSGDPANLTSTNHFFVFFRF